MGEVKKKSAAEIELIRLSSLLVGKTLGEVSKHIQPGVNTLKLDVLAEEFIRDNGAVPGFKDYKSHMGDEAYPYSLCISVNDEIVHGMPGKDKNLEEGDIVSVDCGVYMNEFYGDSAYTFKVGEVLKKVDKLCKVTKESLYKGLEFAVAGNRLGDIANAIQKHVETNSFTIVREMVGHGIGKNLHEPPEIPNFGRRNTGLLLEEGMVFAIEPMVNLGKRHIFFGRDGWTVKTYDGKPSAHYEHTIAIGKERCDILSTFEFIEQEIESIHG